MGLKVDFEETQKYFMFKKKLLPANQLMFTKTKTKTQKLEQSN
jgi:hypothetical protein